MWQLDRGATGVVANLVMANLSSHDSHGGALTGSGTWHKPTDPTVRAVITGMLTILIDPATLGTHLPAAGYQSPYPMLAAILEICLHPTLHQSKNKKARYLLNSRLFISNLVGRVGLEPTTKGL